MWISVPMWTSRSGRTASSLDLQHVLGRVAAASCGRRATTPSAAPARWWRWAKSGACRLAIVAHGDFDVAAVTDVKADRVEFDVFARGQRNEFLDDGFDFEGSMHVLKEDERLFAGAVRLATLAMIRRPSRGLPTVRTAISERPGA